MPGAGPISIGRLSRYRELKITVIGRKSGQPITIPVWFVFEDGTLYLLPVQGSETQWYKNVLKHPKFRIDARGAEAEVEGHPIPMPNRSPRQLKNFATSTDPKT